DAVSIYFGVWVLGSDSTARAPWLQHWSAGPLTRGLGASIKTENVLERTGAVSLATCPLYWKNTTSPEKNGSRSAGRRSEREAHPERRGQRSARHILAIVIIFVGEILDVQLQMRALAEPARLIGCEQIQPHPTRIDDP